MRYPLPHLFAFSLLAASGRVGAALDKPGDWSVHDAPYRIPVKAGKAPEDTKNGWLLELPEFGATRPDTRDVILLDGAGKEIALDLVWRGAGRKLLMLAQSIPQDGRAMLYFGGNSSRRFATWTAERSLLMETRRAPDKCDPRTWPGIQAAWKLSPAMDGAGFVENIFQGSNPFGDGHNFLSRFTGTLKIPSDGKWTFYTMSENESYIFIDGKPVLAWRYDIQSPHDPRTVITGEIELKAGNVRVEYDHAMNGQNFPAMVLGWKLNGKMGTIPGRSWLHPGGAQVGSVERQGGGAIPDARVEALDYTGYGGEWFVQVNATLPNVPDGAQVEWTWPDGRKMTGNSVTRLLFKLDPVPITVRVREGTRMAEGIRMFIVPQQLREMSVNSESDISHYLALMDDEDPATLPEDARRAGFVLAEDFAPPATQAKWAEAYVKTATPGEGVWVRAQNNRLLWLARKDPRAALQALSSFSGEAKQQMRESYPRLELDLLVFGTQDASVPGHVVALQSNRDSSLAKFARIRLGDYHRLLGHFKEALESYRSAMDLSPETLRKGPVLDKAMSLSIEDLIKDKRPAEARTKLAEWERLRPVAKLESDFLLWRARILGLDGDWKGALQELESSRKARPNSPEEIEVRFWQARALYELGHNREAREIWNSLAKDYPKHERAEACKQWASKS